MAHFVWNGWAICPVMAQVGSHQSLRVVLLHPCPASVDQGACAAATHSEFSPVWCSLMADFTEHMER